MITTGTIDTVWAVITPPGSNRIPSADPVTSLPNLILDRRLLPELVQWDAKPESIAREVARLLSDQGGRDAQLAGYREVMTALRPEGTDPSLRAAQEVLALLEETRRKPGSNAFLI